MNKTKKRLLDICEKIESSLPISPADIQHFLTFQKKTKENRPLSLLKAAAVPVSLAIGFLFTVFPAPFKHLAQGMPPWTNLSPPLLTGVDYLWDLLGEPIGKANIIYHVPNVVLYSFGIIGAKNLIEAIDKRTWLDRVYAAQRLLREKLDRGDLPLRMKVGHSLLFVGRGDFIGMQFAYDHAANEAVTISQVKPSYTQIWNYYDVDTLYEDLKNVILRSDGTRAGEYIFFPVKDDQIFLPGEKAYDLSPHKLDIICQNIRVIEKELGLQPKRIIVVGDRFHTSYVHSEDQEAVIDHSEDVISIGSISKKYPAVSVLDPTDIVLKRILEIADGRKIVFRATKEGIAEYKKRFYERLKLLGYASPKGQKGILTIGYDIFEDQTEQQTLSRQIDDYFPVVLSKNVHDALLRNGYKKKEFLYVPDLVLKTLSEVAAEQ